MQGKRRNGALDRGVAKTCFLLIEPKGFGNAGEVARRMARCRGVKEVHLTSGRFGFVVSANVDSKDEAEKIGSALRRVAKGKSVSMAMSHFVYR